MHLYDILSWRFAVWSFLFVMSSNTCYYTCPVVLSTENAPLELFILYDNWSVTCQSVTKLQQQSFFDHCIMSLYLIIFFNTGQSQSFFYQLLLSVSYLVIRQIFCISHGFLRLVLPNVNHVNMKQFDFFTIKLILYCFGFTSFLTNFALRLCFFFLHK